LAVLCEQIINECGFISLPLFEQDLDLMFVQDSSGSMADDIQTFRTLATSLVNAVLKLSKTAMTGLASFIEKPVFPQVVFESRQTSHDVSFDVRTIGLSTWRSKVSAGRWLSS
jgi:hypothetical protein